MGRGNVIPCPMHLAGGRPPINCKAAAGRLVWAVAWRPGGREVATEGARYYVTPLPAAPAELNVRSCVGRFGGGGQEAAAGEGGVT